MKTLKIFFSMGIAASLMGSATAALAQDVGACNYTAAALDSWKALIKRQLLVLDANNAPRLTAIASDIIDGQSAKLSIDMAEINANTSLKLAGGEMSLLELAVAACRPEIAKELINLGASVDGVGYSTPLVTASAKGQDSLAEYLIQRGARVDKIDSNGMTALEAAVRQRKSGAVSVLLKHGVTPNIKLANGGTILDIVSHSNDSVDKEIASELGRYGAISGLAGKDVVDKR